MRDFDKLKDDKGNSNVKPVIIFVLICLVIIGAITYIIINLTSQYHFLNEQYAKVQKKVIKISSDISPESVFKMGEKQKLDNKSESIKSASNNVNIAMENTQVKKGVDTKKIDNEVDIKEVTAKEEIIMPNEVIDKKIDETAANNRSIKNYYLLQLLEGKNIKELNTAEDFYSKYFDNVHIKPNKDGNTFVIRCCATESIDKIKLNKVEVKRRFNINPKIINVSERIYRESDKSDNVDNTNYVIQLSSNTTRKEATDIMNFYKQYYFDTYITTDEVNKSKWYRVRCCFASTIDEAKKRVVEIKDRFNISPIIIATKDELFKESKPEYRYVLELNRKKSLKDAREIVEFYSNYMKDTYISKIKDEKGEDIYSIKCCVLPTESEAENMRNNLKDRFNILSKVIKVDLQKEERIEPENYQGNMNKVIVTDETDEKKSKVHYVLQLASNKVEKETIDMAKFYKKYLDDVHVISQKSDANNIWYKIRCCSTDSLEEANRRLLELKEQFNIEPIIVKTTE